MPTVPEWRDSDSAGWTVFVFLPKQISGNCLWNPKIENLWRIASPPPKKKKKKQNTELLVSLGSHGKKNTRTPGLSRGSPCCRMKSNMLHENPPNLWSLLSQIHRASSLPWTPMVSSFLLHNEESQQSNMPRLLSPTGNANLLLTKQN